MSSALTSTLLSQSFPCKSTSKNLKVGLWAVAIFVTLYLVFWYLTKSLLPILEVSVDRRFKNGIGWLGSISISISSSSSLSLISSSITSSLISISSSSILASDTGNTWPWPSACTDSCSEGERGRSLTSASWSGPIVSWTATPTILISCVWPSAASSTPFLILCAWLAIWEA